MDLIPIPGAEVYYDDRFLPPEEATQLFNTLLSKCAWERHRASFGHTVPRDEGTASPERATRILGASTNRCLGYRSCSR
jgi:hypothetical protein